MSAWLFVAGFAILGTAYLAEWSENDSRLSLIVGVLLLLAAIGSVVSAVKP